MKPEMITVRPTIASSFSVSGKTNMTGLTLLGHCLLTSSLVDDITFAKEFRRKMDQQHIWAGEFKTGSLSDKQKEILLEKKRVTNEVQAKLLGSGFFKYVGIDTSAWTAQELDFWEEQQSETQASPQEGMTFVSTPPRNRQVTPPAGSASGTAPVNDIIAYTLPSGRTENLSRKAVNFYLSKHQNSMEAVEDSVDSRGAAVFNQIYFTAATRGLASAATIAGGTKT
jgi:hypothetical protein